MWIVHPFLLLAALGLIATVGCSSAESPLLPGSDGPRDSGSDGACAPAACEGGWSATTGGRTGMTTTGPVAQPDCTHGRCSTVCGDGITLGEACDDGNRVDGDGCSSDCEVEEGFECQIGKHCGDATGCDMRVSVTYRDFRRNQPQDFQVGCSQLVKGVVEDTLNDQGKPVLRDGSQACIDSAETFAQWYTDGPNSRTIPGVLTLYETSDGAYVNRYGPRGEPWVDPEGNEYDGDPLFFPLDDLEGTFDDERAPAKLPAQYGYDGWPWESTLDPDAPEPLHNFWFTTEVVSYFAYDENQSPTLEFTGDDDVWVFINHQLAVDLGGVHVPESGSVTLDPANAARLGLEHGGLYPIHVFHAERKMEGSSFKLTLTSFDLQSSVCSGICGDGVVVGREECDDGNTADGDGCQADCRVPLI